MHHKSKQAKHEIAAEKDAGAQPRATLEEDNLPSQGADNNAVGC